MLRRVGVGLLAVSLGCATAPPMGTVDARGACHDSSGRYATASTCSSSGLSEEGAIVLGVVGGAALVGLVVWLVSRSSRPAPTGGAVAPPSTSDRELRGPADEAEEEARLRGGTITRRCLDANGNPVTVHSTCEAAGLRHEVR